MEKDDMSSRGRKNETWTEQVQDLRPNIPKPEKLEMFFLKWKSCYLTTLERWMGRRSSPEDFQLVSRLASLRAIFHV